MMKVLLLLLAAGAWLCEAIQCPAMPSFNGCLVNSCIKLPSTNGKTIVTVCDSCGTGYVISQRGTIHARCDCAPGFAGNGNRAICKRCPAFTQVAVGGTKAASYCYNCPEGTIFVHDQKTCVCPAGSHRAKAAKAASGMMPVKCVACTGLKQFVALANNTLSSCGTCPSGKVANKDHTFCVEPSDSNAATVTTITATPSATTKLLVTNSTNLLQDVATQFQQAIAGITGTTTASDNGAFSSSDTVGTISETDWSS